MAVAEIIGSAVGAMLLIVVAYLLIGNVLSAAEIVSSAQKDLTLSSEMRLQTNIQITNVTIGTPLNFTVENTGNQIITDFPHTNVFIYAGTSVGYQNYTYDPTGTGTPGTWTKAIIDDYVHPGELDPGETMFVDVYTVFTPPFDVGICTNNGVYASRFVY